MSRFLKVGRWVRHRALGSTNVKKEPERKSQVLLYPLPRVTEATDAGGLELTPISEATHASIEVHLKLSQGSLFGFEVGTPLAGGSTALHWWWLNYLAGAWKLKRRLYVESCRLWIIRTRCKKKRGRRGARRE